MIAGYINIDSMTYECTQETIDLLLKFNLIVPDESEMPEEPTSDPMYRLRTMSEMEQGETKLQYTPEELTRLIYCLSNTGEFDLSDEDIVS